MAAVSKNKLSLNLGNNLYRKTISCFNKIFWKNPWKNSSLVKLQAFTLQRTKKWTSLLIFFGVLCTFQGYSFQGTPLSGCFHNESNNSKIPKKSCRGNLYKFRGKRLCRMQILLTVEELKVSIDNGRGGILIK